MLETRAAGYVAGLTNVERACAKLKRHLKMEPHKEEVGLALPDGKVDVETVMQQLDAAIAAMLEMQAAFVKARGK